MKIKLFAGIAAIAVAAVCTVGFTACVKKTPPYKVTTEEQWQQALEKTFTAENYTVTGERETTSSVSTGISQSQSEITGEVIYLYDGVNGVLYNYERQTTTTTRTVGENTITEPAYTFESEAYFEVWGTDVKKYSKTSLSTLWKESLKNGETERDAFSYLKSQGIAASISLDGYTVEENGEAKSLVYLFNEFTYNSATDTFSATLTMVSGNSVINGVQITLKFANGLLYSMQSEYSTVDSQSGMAITSKISYVFTDYNCTTVTVPEEVKTA